MKIWRLQNIVEAGHIGSEVRSEIRRIDQRGIMRRNDQENDLLLFEGTILSYAVHANNARSGMFVETFEVFKQFLKRNTKMLVMCDVLMYFSMKKTLKQYFPDDQIDIMYYVRWEQSLGGSSPLEIKLRHMIKCMGFAFLQIVMSVINTLNGKRKRVLDARAFFSTGYVPPRYIDRNETIRKYICLQDAIPVLYQEYFPQMRDSRFWYRLLIDRLNPLERYFAISQATKDDFCRLFPQLPPDRVTVTYLGKNDRYRYLEKPDIKVLGKYGLERNSKYFFSLCTVEPRKNLLRSVKSFIRFIRQEKITDLYYVIGGGKWKTFYDQLLAEFEGDVFFQDYVKMIGYVEDEELPHLYNQAMCFVFTSQYEGFGLPVLEAMSCGCPVITSTSSSLPEVAGDAGLTVAWDSEEEHIEAYRQIFMDEGLRVKLHAAGLARAELFSWEKCADIMLREIYE